MIPLVEWLERGASTEHVRNVRVTSEPGRVRAKLKGALLSVTGVRFFTSGRKEGRGRGRRNHV